MHALNSIPAILRNSPMWVNYLLQKRQAGNLAKVPINPHTGGYASVSDPTTWGSYEQAIQQSRTNPRISGIGYVFSEADPFAGIDLDHCREPKTGAIEPLALARITTFDSYSEISVSGTGIHIIVMATLPDLGRHKGNIEIYDRKRFFVVTGNHLIGTSTTINSRQNMVEALYQEIAPDQPLQPVPIQPSLQDHQSDVALIERILRSRQAEKFRRLLAGDTTGYQSHSEADLALCAILSFWTNYEDQIDHIFQGSGLYRPKWIEMHGQGGLTYGEITIRRALKFRHH
jgi:putative DNA primase/helicase